MIPFLFALSLQPILLPPENGSVEFKAIGHPSALKVLGKGKGLVMHLVKAGDQVSGTATFDLDSLDTGISLRNRHMREKYLETKLFPQAKFILTPLTIALQDIPFTGKLWLHGVEKSISGLAQIEKKEAEYSFTAHFSLKISDFKIDIPSFMGITVADEVDVTVTN